MSARRRFALAAAIGGSLGFAVFASLVVSAGAGSLLAWQRIGDFYDVQAHAFLDGDLAVDEYPLGIEAFFNDGRAYLYQGPFPALARLPVILVAGDDLDGRLTSLSMLTALTVAIVASARLHWRVRGIVRPGAPCRRGEMAAVGLASFAVGGSMFLFHASRAWVYHEAILWAAAFTILAVDQLLRHRTEPSGRALLLASAFTLLALWSRASTGIGPLVGLGLVAASDAWAWLRAHDRPFARVALGAAATAVPLLAYVGLNVAKFETLVSVPFWEQRYSQVDEARKEFLRRNGGTFFGVQFVPTTAVRYLLPTGLDLRSGFPFVDLAPPPAERESLGATFDVIDRAAGAPAGQPLLFALGAAGVVALVRRRDLATLRVPAVAAAASAATIFPFGYVAYRYMGDAAPLLLLASFVGIQVGLSRRRSRTLAAAAVAVAGVLTVAATWINGAAGLQYQRMWSAEADPGLVAGYLRWKFDIDERLGIDPPTIERAGAELPPAFGRPGALAVVGECEGFYFSDGDAVNAVDLSPWNLVELARSGGHVRLDLDVPRRPPGTRVPVIDAGDDRLDLTYLDGSVRVDHAGSDVDRRGVTLPYPDSGRLRLDIWADRRVRHVVVFAGTVAALDSFWSEPEPLTVSWPFGHDELPVETPLCDRLVDR